MDSSLLSALGTGLSATTFLAGFSSVRLRAQRDRALGRADTITRELTKLSPQKDSVTDRDVELAAEPFAETKNTDPIGLWTVILGWLIAVTMTVLCIAYGTLSNQSIQSLSAKNFGVWSASFFILLAIVIALLATTDLLWIRSAVKKDLRASVLGLTMSALSARRSGDLPLAKKKAEELIYRVPSWPWPHAFLGHIHTQNKNYSAALETFNEAVRLEPTNVWWKVARSEVLLFLERRGDALEELSKLEDAMPRDPRVLRHWGTVLYANDRVDEAVAAYDEAIGLDPLDAETRIDRGRALSRGNSEGMHSTQLQDLLLSDSSDSASRVLARAGIERMIAEDMKLAIRDFDIAIRQDPRNWRVRSLRGAALFAVGRVQDAENDFAIAIQETDARNEVLYQHGSALLAIESNSRALELLDESLRLKPTAHAYGARAAYFLTERRWLDAIEDLNKGLLIEPERNATKRLLAAAYYENEQVDDANSLFQEVLASRPTDLATWSLWANVAYTNNNISQAQEVIKDATSTCEASEELANLHLLQSRIYKDARLFSKAHTAIEEALVMGASQNLVEYNRALVLREQNELPRALAYLQRPAESTWQRQVAALVTRAAVLSEMGAVNEAILDWTSTIMLEPKNANLYLGRAVELMHIGAAPQSLADIDTALELDADNFNALIRKAVVLCTVDSRDPDIAVVLARALNVPTATEKDRLEVEAEVFFARHNWDAAAAIYQDLLRIDENDEDALGSLAACYNNLGSFSDAEGVFNRLAATSPWNLHYRACAAVCASQQLDSPRALEIMTDIIVRFGSNNVSAWLSTSLHRDFLLHYDEVMADWQAAGATPANPST